LQRILPLFDKGLCLILDKKWFPSDSFCELFKINKFSLLYL